MSYLFLLGPWHGDVCWVDGPDEEDNCGLESWSVGQEVDLEGF